MDTDIYVKTRHLCEKDLIIQIINQEEHSLPREENKTGIGLIKDELGEKIMK